MVVKPSALLIAALLCVASSVYAQEVVPRDAEAESLFEVALQAFESADYDLAYDRFRTVYERSPLHRKTTAATLMAGKALYRRGAYSECIDLLSAFRTQYRSSSYLMEAERLIAYARLRLQHDQERSRALLLGVALPMNAEDRALAQSLFSGVRIAVDEHNRRYLPPIRIIFRDTQNSESGARRAVGALVEEGVDAIIGPLYSDEVLAAARVADRADVVLMAPLATSGRITRGRRHIFQANPTIDERGRFMARRAVESLGFLRLGVAAERSNDISERMAEGFHREARRLGAEVVFHARLSSDRDWARIPDLIEPDVLASIDAIFLSVHSDQDYEVHRIVEETLTRFGRISSPPHVLGGSAWRNVSSGPNRQRSAVSYADVFFVNDMRREVRTFKQSYKAISQGAAPGRLAYVGYDVAQFLIHHLLEPSEGSLAASIRLAPLYEGIGTRIKFDEDRRNEAMFLFHYTEQGVRLAR